MKIEELRRLLGTPYDGHHTVATTLPWQASNHYAREGPATPEGQTVRTQDDDLAFCVEHPAWPERAALMALAIAAVNALPALLDVAEQAEKCACTLNAFVQDDTETPLADVKDAAVGVLDALAALKRLENC